MNIDRLLIAVMALCLLSAIALCIPAAITLIWPVILLCAPAIKAIAVVTGTAGMVAGLWV